jgi:hypothetical protein
VSVHEGGEWGHEGVAAPSSLKPIVARTKRGTGNLSTTKDTKVH